ncbi:hypothetical protein D7Y13_29010 [Corallococcus praedator]|uniref:Secreted protein n=1 Tax=Corallococcus praedator TaxID=2316724 RepID=A0ABX9QB23_9BACT|nr:hypothetical protein D7X75_31915 [Corallococcus sp. CA031C]RKH98321.1 hypothetical protein D7Y13_29010 [Corallococcus praedator]
MLDGPGRRIAWAVMGQGLAGAVQGWNWARAHSVGMWLCALGCLSACPEVHRRGGFADRAVHRDAVEQVPEAICRTEVFELYCSEGREQSDECIEACE